MAFNRPKHFTLHHVIHLLNHIAENNYKATKEHTLAVFIYLSKAFDTISHDILINKFFITGELLVVSTCNLYQTILRQVD